MFQRKGVKTTFRLLMLLGSCVKTSFDIVSTIVLPWLLVGEKHFHKILCQTLKHWLPPILRVWRKLLYQKLVKFQLNFIWACGYNYGLSGLLNSWTNCNAMVINDADNYRQHWCGTPAPKSLGKKGADKKRYQFFSLFYKTLVWKTTN